MADANEVVRAQQFASVVAETSTDALGRYRAEREDLRDEVAALEREQDERAATVEDLRKRQADAVNELDRLARLAEQARGDRAAQQRKADADAAAAPAPASPAARTAGGPRRRLPPRARRRPFLPPSLRHRP